MGKLFSFVGYIHNYWIKNGRKEQRAGTETSLTSSDTNSLSTNAGKIIEDIQLTLYTMSYKLRHVENNKVYEQHLCLCNVVIVY